jgi:hypothetical protein
MSEDKVRIKDLCWSMGVVYDTTGLSGVSTAGSEAYMCYNNHFSKFNKWNDIFIKEILWVDGWHDIRKGFASVETWRNFTQFSNLMKKRNHTWWNSQHGKTGGARRRDARRWREARDVMTNGDGRPVMRYPSAMGGELWRRRACGAGCPSVTPKNNVLGPVWRPRLF